MDVSRLRSGSALRTGPETERRRLRQCSFPPSPAVAQTCSQPLVVDQPGHRPAVDSEAGAAILPTAGVWPAEADWLAVPRAGRSLLLTVEDMASRLPVLLALLPVALAASARAPAPEVWRGAMTYPCTASCCDGAGGCVKDLARNSPINITVHPTVSSQAIRRCQAACDV